MALSNRDTKALQNCYSKATGHKALTVVALSGEQGNRSKYTAKLSFKAISDNFDILDGTELPEGVVLQRKPTIYKAKEIETYIKSNSDFILSNMTVVAQSLEVKSTSLKNVVKLTLPESAFRYFVDGQTRLLAIKRLVAKSKEYHDHVVDVEFIESVNHVSDAQVFCDINANQSSINSALNISTDSRALLNQFIKDSVTQNDNISGRIDFEKSAVPSNSKSEAIWSISQYMDFVLAILGVSVTDAEDLISNKKDAKSIITFLVEFFDALSENNDIDKALMLGRGDWMTTSIVGGGVFLQALGLFGRAVKSHTDKQSAQSIDWDFMEPIENIDFTTSNSEWIDRCVGRNGKALNSTSGSKAIASYLCSVVGINKTSELTNIESNIAAMRS